MLTPPRVPSFLVPRYRSARLARRGTAAVAAVATATALAALPLDPAHAALPPSALVADNEPGAASGLPTMTGSVSVTGSASAFTFVAQTQHGLVEGDFAAPSGLPVVPGTYPTAATPGPGTAGLTADYPDGSCRDGQGQVTIHEYQAGSSGTAVLGMSYRLQCSTGGRTTFVEIRAGAVRPLRAATTDKVLVRLDRAAVNVPVRSDITVSVLGEAPVTFGQAALEPPRHREVPMSYTPGEYRVVSDGCAGRTLPTATSCVVTVELNSATAGLPAADLVVPDNTLRGSRRVAFQAQVSAPPAPVTNVESVSGAERILLRWSGGHNDSGDRQTYRIYRSSEGQARTKIHETDTDGVYFADENVVRATTYRYEIVGVNFAGESEPVVQDVRTSEVSVLYSHDVAGLRLHGTGTADYRDLDPGADVDRPRTPVLDPAERRVAFVDTTTASDRSTAGRLTLQTWPGMQQTRRLTGGDLIDRNPAWSYDGTSIVFDRTEPSTGTTSLWTVDPDLPGSLRRVPNSDGLSDPSWSPDGRTIVAGVLTGPQPQTAHGLVTIAPDGAGRHPLRGAERGSGPAYSPDGTAIVFVQRDPVRTWQTRIALLPPAGADTPQHVQHPIGQAHPAGWAADSRRLYFVQRNQDAGNPDTHLGLGPASIYRADSADLTAGPTRFDGVLGDFGAPAVLGPGRPGSVLRAPTSPLPSTTATPSPTTTSSPAPTATASPTGQPSASPMPTSGSDAGSARYTGIQTSRFLDTRAGLGAPRGRAVRTVTLAVPDSIPADAASAVLNISAVDPDGSGFLRVSPGRTAPTSTALNYGDGRSVTGLVVTRIGADRTITLTVGGAATHLVADAVGYFDARPGAGGHWQPFGPDRFVDSRSGAGVRAGRVSGDITVSVHSDIPRDARAVLVNVSVVDADRAGFLRIGAAGGSAATALNVPARQSMTALAVTALHDGQLTLGLRGTTGHVVVDLLGYYRGAGETGSKYRAVTPERFVDTRSGLGGAPGSRTITVQLPASVPAAATNAVINLSAVDPAGSGYLRVSAPGSSTATTAMNYSRGQSQTALAVTPISRDRRITVTVHGSGTGLVADLVGYHTAP